MGVRLQVPPNNMNWPGSRPRKTASPIGSGLPPMGFISARELTSFDPIGRVPQETGVRVRNGEVAETPSPCRLSTTSGVSEPLARSTAVAWAGPRTLGKNCIPRLQVAPGASGLADMQLAV